MQSGSPPSGKSSILSMLSDSFDNYFSSSQDPESSTVAVPRIVQPCDSSFSGFDEHGFPVESEDSTAWTRYHQLSTERQEGQVVAWHEWLCQPAAVDAARHGGVVLDQDLLTLVRLSLNAAITIMISVSHVPSRNQA